MTFNDDIISHGYHAWQFYDHIPRSTDIVEAVREPLTLKELNTKGQRMKDGSEIPFSVALAHAFIDSIIKRFHRRETLLPTERMELAQMIVDEFPHWTVCDLKCCEHMLISHKLATVGNGGQMETGLMNMDESSILGKLRVYDKMRPTGTVYGGNSPQTVIPLRPLTDEQKTHLLNGMEYDFAVPYEDWVQGYSKPSGDPQRNCERYWRAPADYKNDEFDKEAIDRIMAKVKGCVRTLSMADYLSTN